MATTRDIITGDFVGVDEFGKEPPTVPNKATRTCSKNTAKPRREGRSMYMRRALLRVMKLSEIQRSIFKPKNGFEEAALSLVLAAKKGGTNAVAAWREIKETLGEKIGTDASGNQRNRESHAIVNDLPTYTQ